MRHSTRRLSAAVTPACILILMGCAGGPAHHVGVPIDSRPTPQQPDSSGVVHAEPAKPPGMTSQTLHSAEAHINADTTATQAVLARCVGRKLLPDEEGIVDSANQLLADVRAAITASDLVRAQSLARQARQLTTSLHCP